MTNLGVLQGIQQVTAAFAKSGIAKDSVNQSQGFKYRGIDAVLNRMAQHLVDAKLVIVPVVRERTVTERTNSRGNALFYVTLTVDYTIASTVDGSSVVATVVGEAMDSGDKATNKALSVAYKYMAFQVFSIPTDVDPDKDVHEVKAPMIPASNPSLGDTEVEIVRSLLTKAKFPEEKLLAAYNAVSVEDIPLNKMEEIVGKLQQKISKLTAEV